MSKIYSLCAFILLLFGSLDAGFIHNDTIFVDTPESSLDFTKKCPKLSWFMIGYVHNFTKDWPLVRDYYLSQTTDLGLRNNKNLKHIDILSKELVPFFLKTYLPQVSVLSSASINSDALSAFPNLKKIICYDCYDRAPFEKLAIYNPHITTIEMSTWHFADFSNEELIAIAQMKELKNLRYEFWFNIDPNIVIEKQKELQLLFPKIKIELIMTPNNKDEEDD